VEFGVLDEFHWLPDATEADAFVQSFARVDAAEQWGLDVIWLAELHFTMTYSVSSAPLVIGAAIAARTRRIKIGTAVQVLPLGHPLRLAEEAATLDQISNGRLIFGVGRSSFPHIYKAYGIPYPESQERFLETLDIMKLAWSGSGLSYQGKYYSFAHPPKLTIVPRPVQKPYPPLRVAITSVDSYAAMGRLGYPIFIALRYNTAAELAALVRTYREAYRSAGHPGDGAVYLRVPVYVADTYQQARNEPEESFMHLLRLVGERFGDSANRSGARAIEQRADVGNRLQSITYEEALQEKVIVGTPPMVVDRLMALRDQITLDGIAAELNSGSLIPHERVMKALRLFCHEVMPHFK
jgi:alkanesulfonate monooxygenase SsuD/methylene tetrahydromethanopterin reductase-like flavin-dependent oxidoreductase (luciferase family)